MQFCKEMNYDGQLGGCINIVITRILYFIDYVLPNRNYLSARPTRCTSNISRITIWYSFLQFRKCSW